MSKHSFLSLVGVLLFSFIYLSACENPGNSLEESVAPYLELQAVDGASNVTMTVNRGAAQGLDSYFAIDFTNFDSNGIVPEGLTEGWCLDYSRPIEQNNDVHQGVKMFNTHGSEDWKSANYLMNIKDELKQNDPSLTYKEIQVALWSLIKVPSFDVDKALSDGTMPSRMMTNGAPNFNVEKTKGIVKKVQAEVNAFTYKPGTPVIVYSNVSDVKQPVGGVFGETAWAFSPNVDGTVNTDISKEFCGNNGTHSNKWGWSNGTFNKGDTATFDIVAGAGNCNIEGRDIVGSIMFNYQADGTLKYTLSLTVDNDFEDLHIHAGEDILPVKSNGNGGFESGYNSFYKRDLDGGTGTITGDIEDIDGTIYIAVHLG